MLLYVSVSPCATVSSNITISHCIPQCFTMCHCMAWHVTVCEVDWPGHGSRPRPPAVAWGGRRQTAAGPWRGQASSLASSPRPSAAGHRNWTSGLDWRHTALQAETDQLAEITTHGNNPASTTTCCVHMIASLDSTSFLVGGIASKFTIFSKWRTYWFLTFLFKQGVWLKKSSLFYSIRVILYNQSNNRTTGIK